MRKVVGAAFVLWGVIVVGACGSDDGDDGAAGGTEQRLCAKADECNLLQGATAQDCTDTLRSCTEELTTAQRADWNNAINDCLEMQDCTNVAACYAAVPGC